MSKLILLQGPPASGKSTWRKEYISNNPEWNYVNADELRLAHPNERESSIQEMMHSNARVYFTCGISFIVDNTNLNPYTVERWKNLAAHYKYEFEIKQFFDVDYLECVRRDSFRTNPVGKSVIWRMYIDAGLIPSQTKKGAVIIDLDGTLCDTSKRQHYVLNKPKNWKAFFDGISEDVPNSHVEFLYKQLIYSGVDILFVSGRDEKYRKVTEEWLYRYNFYFDLLLMRGFNDRRDDTVVKAEIYDKYIAPYYNVKFAVDDRDRVVKMWRDKGIPCFQCNYGDF